MRAHGRAQGRQGALPARRHRARGPGRRAAQGRRARSPMSSPIARSRPSRSVKAIPTSTAAARAADRRRHVHQRVVGAAFRQDARRGTGARPAVRHRRRVDRPGDGRSGAAARHHLDDRAGRVHRAGARRRRWSSTSAKELAAMNLPRRPRRLRRTPAIRALVRETRLSADQLVYPLFVCEGSGVRRECRRCRACSSCRSTRRCARRRRRGPTASAACCCSGCRRRKDAVGSAAWDPQAPVQRAVRAINAEVPDARRHHRRLPLRVHRARPLRRARRRAHPQRSDRRAAGPIGGRRTPRPAPTSSRRPT